MRRAAAAVSGLLVAAVFCAILLGIARRYLFGTPLVWADELATVLFIWAIFWSGAFVVGAREHVAFDLVHGALPPKAAAWTWRIACLIAGVALLAALPKTWSYISFLWRERTPALQWRLDFVYVCFALFVAASALRFLWEAVRKR
jgi:TRAP-type C4-dicarboxylate transport system permease small subunit